MLRRAPVKKLSTQTTIAPLASSRSQRCEPRKPAPPVTSTRFSRCISSGPVFPSLMLRVGRRKSFRSVCACSAASTRRPSRHRSTSARVRPNDGSKVEPKNTMPVAPLRSQRRSRSSTCRQIKSESAPLAGMFRIEQLSRRFNVCGSGHRCLERRIDRRHRKRRGVNEEDAVWACLLRFIAKRVEGSELASLQNDRASAKATIFRDPGADCCGIHLI